MDLLSFAVITFLAVVSPGPNVVLIVVTTIDNGKKSGFITVVSVFFSMAIQALMVIFLLEYLLTISNILLYIQWLGIAYFLYLTIDALLLPQSTLQPSTGQLIGRAFLVALTNPKTIIFFSALFPQFLIPHQDYFLQMGILTAVFLAIALVCDITYVLFSNFLRTKLQDIRTIKIIKVLSYFIITMYLLVQNIMVWQ